MHISRYLSSPMTYLFNISMPVFRQRRSGIVYYGHLLFISGIIAGCFCIPSCSLLVCFSLHTTRRRSIDRMFMTWLDFGTKGGAFGVFCLGSLILIILAVTWTAHHDTSHGCGASVYRCTSRRAQPRTWADLQLTYIVPQLLDVNITSYVSSNVYRMWSVTIRNSNKILSVLNRPSI